MRWCAPPLFCASPAERARKLCLYKLRPTPWLALILFGFFLGFAVLAKGPAAIILCGGAVFFWAIFTKRWRDGFRLFHPVAIAAFCLTSLPWYILCARRNPDFFRIFIIEHNFKRFLTPEFQHIQPFWFYGPIMLLALIPWIALPPDRSGQICAKNGELDFRGDPLFCYFSVGLDLRFYFSACRNPSCPDTCCRLFHQSSCYSLRLAAISKKRPLRFNSGRACSLPAQFSGSRIGILRVAVFWQFFE